MTRTPPEAAAASGIVDPAGRAVESPVTFVEGRAVPTRCPGCGAPPKRRVKSAGFGQPHDVCVECGHEFSLRESQP